MLNIQHIRRCATGGVVAAAISFPAGAQAMRPLADPPSTPNSGLVGLAVPSTSTSGQPGFQWDDAAIGAAGAVMLLGAGASASGLARRRRGHRTAIGDGGLAGGQSRSPGQQGEPTAWHARLRSTMRRQGRGHFEQQSGGW